ncbi:MAG: Rad52/Rad22 family DNA repair protein [Roseburia sp.]|nr:Rad52/Rad22 family DNA repair protein [Roseburia sp.]
MNIKQIPLLNADDIEVRIQQACRDNKALALLYKTSRTDMRILDEVFGIDGWKDDYKEIRGNLYCGISIYDDDKKEWITKWDCGIESQQGDGNEKKAEASDAFKRAGTKIGIGRELYTSPIIYVKADTKDSGRANKNGKPIYVLEHPFETYSVKEIDYNDKREITRLVIVDSKNTVVYSYGTKKTACTS